MAQADELLTSEEAAEALGRTVTTLHQWRHKNTGPVSYRSGGRLVYRRSDIDAFLAREREATTRGIRS